MCKVIIYVNMFLFSTLSLNSYAGNNYFLKGEITGFFITANKCYISIHDDQNKFYSDQWHFVENKKMCDFVQGAYLTRLPIIASVAIDTIANDANNIESIKSMSISCEITWPPYRENENCKERSLKFTPRSVK